MVLSNRALAFFVIWTTAILVAHRKQAQEALERAHDELEDRVRRRTAALRESETQTRLITDNLPVLIAYIDKDERYRFANSTFEQFFRKPRSQIVGQLLKDVVGEANYDRVRPHVRAVLSGTTARFETELEYPDDVQRSLDFTYVPDRAKNGEVQGYFALIMDITERKRIEEDRNRALIEAENANRAKSNFLAEVSHELRTPLNAILGFSEVLSHEYFGPLGQKKYQEYAADIHASGEHLLALISDILDLSTIEAGKLSLNKEALCIEEIASECMSIVTGNAGTKGVTLTTELSGELAPLHADRRAVRQILLNLLTNAIKFTPEGGSITLQVQESENSMALKIADTGVGIPVEKLPNLAEPFTRLEQDPHNTVEGWGLGLAITKSLMELHEGELQIESEVGKGTTVTVTFPKTVPN